jgi:hypothetical protein
LTGITSLRRIRVSKVLVSYEFDVSDELAEDLWLIRHQLPMVWNGRTNTGRVMIFTLALDPEDATFVSLHKKICKTPAVWKNALTTGGVT